MTSFFNEGFRQALLAGTITWPNEVVAVLFPMAPRFSEGDPRYTGMDCDTIDELQETLGWGPPLHWGEAADTEIPLTLGVTPQPGAKYVPLDNAFTIPDEAPALMIRAVAFVYKGTVAGVVDPIIFVTDNPVGREGMVLYPGDSITARPDGGVSGMRWLFSYLITDPPDPAPTTIATIAGPLATLKVQPPFDASRTQHVWLYPQRVNLIANPSFEGGMTRWRSNATMQQIDGGCPGGGVKAGQFSGGPRIIAESNLFPLAWGRAPQERFTLRINARGNGRMKVALLSWMPDFLETKVDWGVMAGPNGELVEAEYLLSPHGFLPVVTLRETPESRFGMLRVEVDGDLLVLDNCLVEEGWVPAGQDGMTGGGLSTGFPYFDGDTTYGDRGDYSWYGGEDCQGHTYSCWYNHRQAVVGRLFAYQTAQEDLTQTLPPTWVFDPAAYSPQQWFTAPRARVLNDLMDQASAPVFLDTQAATDALLTNIGSVDPLDGTVVGARRILPEAKSYIWVPRNVGNTISVPDETALDIKSQMTVIAEIAPDDWTPPTEEVLVSKWLNAGITPGTAGYVTTNSPANSVVTTPNTANLQITTDVVITARVRFTGNSPDGMFLVGVAPTGTTNDGWRLVFTDATQSMIFKYSTNGTNGFFITNIANFDYAGTTADAFVGVVIQRNVSGVARAQAIRSMDGGVTWTNWGTAKTNTAFTSTFASTGGLRIGNAADMDSTQHFKGRVYWIEMRTGTVPGAGTQIFRFDASNAPPATTTMFPSPPTGGRTYTLSAAAMLVKAGNGTPIGNSWVYSVLPDGKLQLLWAVASPPPYTSAAFDVATSDAAVTGTPQFNAFTFINNNGNGNSETRFWTSPDKVTWAQLGSTILRPVASLLESTARVEVMSQNNAEANRHMEGKFYSLEIHAGVETGGTVDQRESTRRLLIDCAVLTPDDYGEPTFDAVTGQTVTVSRGTSGYVGTMVPSIEAGGRPFFMLDGIDDTITVPHASALTLPDNGYLTVIMVGRQKATVKANTNWVNKVETVAPNVGWQLDPDTSTFTGKIKDATNPQVVSNALSLPTRNVPTAYGFRMAVDKLVAVRDSQISAPVNAVLGTVDSAVGITIGRAAGSAFEAFDFFAFTVVTGPLDDTELSNMAVALRDMSDVYHNGDRWSCSGDGTFQGLVLQTGDVLVATHPTGATAPMKFSEVVWGVETEGGGVVTNIDVESQGLVYKWMPSGLVVYHLDVLFPYDTRPCPPPVTGPPVDIPDPWEPPPPPDTTPPTAPTLTATVIGRTQIDLTWTGATDDTGIARYLLERAIGAGSTDFRQIIDTSGTAYSDIGLAEATVYRYRVRAVDLAGNVGPYSDIVEAETEMREALWDVAIWDDDVWQ